MRSDPLSYSYFIDFVFPSKVSDDEDFHKPYEVDEGLTYTVISEKDKRASLFQLVAHVTASNPLSHKPNDYETHAKDIRRLYSILWLSIYFLTGVTVSRASVSKPHSSLFQLYEPADPRHDFYIRASDAGINVPIRPAPATATASAFLPAQLTTELLSKLLQFAKRVRSDESESQAKFCVLEHYFLGAISRDNPYPNWHQIMEIAQDEKIGFFKENHKEIEIGGRKIDLDLLRKYGNYHRHSESHPKRKGNSDWLKRNATGVDWLRKRNRRKARSEYGSYIKTIAEHIILECQPL